MDDKPQRDDETGDSADVDPGNPPGTDSSIQFTPDPTDPKRERGRGTEDDSSAKERPG